VGAPISLDRVAVHSDCWCVCLCYLHFSPENPQDGKMYLLVPPHPGCPGQSPESRKMVVCVCVLLLANVRTATSMRNGCYIFCIFLANNNFYLEIDFGK